MAKQPNKKQRESFFNLHFTTIISISLVLFMVGLISYMFALTYKVTQYEKENMSLTAILDDSISAEEVARIEKYLTSSHYVKDFSYINSDSALIDFIAFAGEDPTLLLGYNPLPSTFEINLKAQYACTDSIENAIIPRLNTFNGIIKFTYQQDLVDLITNNINRLSILFSAVALILLFISIVLINNTVRISIYSKRFTLNTMKLVGAKNSFIRKPYLGRSCVNALIGAVLSLVMLYGALYFAQTQVGETYNLFDLEIIGFVASVVVILSLIINLIATAAAVNRYLRMNSGQLHFI